MAGSERLCFELDRLLDYGDQDILAEMRRVAPLVSEPKLTRARFDALAKVSSSTMIKRFGGWRAALERAGLEDRYSGRLVTDKMRTQVARSLTNVQMAAELQRIARKLGTDILTREQLNGCGDALMTYEAVTRRFGSWKKALAAAGLRLSNLGRRYTDDEYFENLLAVWTHHARAPKFREMNEPPSAIPGGAYEGKWGRWSLALHAFVERVNADNAAPFLGPPPVNDSPPTSAASAGAPARRDEERREIRIGLRYAVLSRDRFRCVSCGASPATTIACRLHVDHIVPFSKGGKTVLDNLQTLCAACNVGKGNRTAYGDRGDAPDTTG